MEFLNEIEFRIFLNNLRNKFDQIWCLESSKEGFDSLNPSKNQCAATSASIALMHKGVDILTCNVNGQSHWYNMIQLEKLNSTYFFDITGDQFGLSPVIYSQERIYKGRHATKPLASIGKGVLKRANLLIEKLNN